jgi:hypothetical protein
MSIIASVMSAFAIIGIVNPPFRKGTSPSGGKIVTGVALAFNITNAVGAIFACAALIIVVLVSDYRASMSIASMNRIMRLLSRIILACITMIIASCALAAYNF